VSIPFAFTIPFIELIGCTLERFDDGEAEVALVVDEARHTNSFGVAHGGLSMTLLDVAMAHAARSLNKQQADGGPGLVTIEMKTTFMRPGTGRLRVVGKVLHATASMAFTEGHVYDKRGSVCAHATATFKFLHGLPVHGRDVRPAAKANQAPAAQGADATDAADAPKLQGPGSD
jgi:uncharacterized protein (TIGR00369 family)